jgi:peptidoglycan hydrolase CwlO-like protein
MRKTAVVAMALVAALLAGATVVSYSKYKKSVADYRQATTEQESMRARYDQAVSEIVAIQDSLNTIVAGEGGVQVSLAQNDVEVQQPGTLHDRTLERISMLKSSIARTKERIEELDARLKRNGVKIASLNKMIAGLKQSVNEREEQIASLNSQVTQLEGQVTWLNTEVSSQKDEIATRQQELAEKQRELATIYYTIGTKKELAKAGVVDSKGGVLGLGKTIKLTGNLDQASFTPLNTDDEKVIRVPAEKVQVLSAQPVTSYSLQHVSKDMVEIQIIHPEEFRKIKHLVILASS